MSRQSVSALRAKETSPGTALGLLRIDLACAVRERDEAQWAQDPFEAAFKASHAFLASLPPQPVVTKAVRLAAYDARVEAGHAWHPYRARLREANRWIKAIKEEMEWYE
jgi:hypothetical protein